jgi:crotonobetainyl-CoA:carnitine CoA-transferase CaiB-like acyl-CoA transferase
LRVLDLGAHPATALASMILADFGATVSCVNRAEIAAHPAAPMLLRGKTVLEGEPDDALAQADVIITTLGPDEPGPVRADHQLQLNITGWGLRGPYARYPMREALVAAKSGRMLTLEGQIARQGPAYAAVQVATLAAAQFGVQGILAALLVREHSGRGQRVETSLLQGLMPYDFLDLSRAELTSRFPGRLVAGFALDGKPTLGYQPVQAADGRWLQMGNIFDHLFKSYLKLAGLAELPPEADRGRPFAQWGSATQERVRDAMLARMRARPAAEWRTAFDTDGNVAAAPFQTTQEALDDPDMLRPGDVIDAEHPTLGKVRWLGPVAHLSATPARIVAAPEHVAAPAQPKRGVAPSNGAGQQAQDKAAPLAGITILEFASVVATPLALSGLAELGARIIKVEPIGGDPGRYIGLGALELIPIKANAGKESICIELKSPKGREILDRLLPMADVIAHNFRPGVPDKLGFGYARARDFNPRVVWLSANGFHPDAPGANRPCAHPIAGAQCGGALFQAGRGMPPAATDDVDALRSGAEILYRANEGNPDPNTSMVIGTAVMLGLAAARRLGVGQQVNVDMMQANLYANFDDALRYKGKPARREPDANLFGLDALNRLYACREGWVFLSVEDNAERERLRAALDLKDPPRDDEALAARLTGIFAADAADTWEAKLAAAGVGCVRADGRTPGLFWQNDAHARANGFVMSHHHRRYGEFLRNGPLMTFSESAVRCRAGSLAGDHTDALLKELGYAEDAVAALRAEKVVWSESLEALA